MLVLSWTVSLVLGAICIYLRVSQKSALASHVMTEEASARLLKQNGLNSESLSKQLSDCQQSTANQDKKIISLHSELAKHDDQMNMMRSQAANQEDQEALLRLQLRNRDQDIQTWIDWSRNTVGIALMNRHVRDGTSSSSVLKLFTVTKDEPGLIEPWLHYHRRIFGEENIIVMDNLTTDTTHLKAYRKFPDLDLRFTSHYTQGKHALRICQEVNAGLVVLLDTDEFILGANGETDAEMIRSTLMRLSLNDDAVSYTYGPSCETKDWPSFEEEIMETQNGILVGNALRVSALSASTLRNPNNIHAHKIIVRAADVTSVSDGYHTCNDIIPTVVPELMLFHFHKRPFMAHIQHAVYDLQGFGILPPGNLLSRDQTALDLYMAILKPHSHVPGQHKLDFLQKVLNQCPRAQCANDLPTLSDFQKVWESDDVTSAEQPNTLLTEFGLDTRFYDSNEIGTKAGTGAPKYQPI